MSSKKIIASVNNYYTQKVKTFGATPQGVDWNSTESQEIRFKNLLKVLSSSEEHFSLLDYGCGYGALFEFMEPLFKNMQYIGFDISEEMILNAKKLFQKKSNAHWFSKKKSLPVSNDYTVASGIFNVKLENTNKEWKKYIIKTINELNNLSTKGFSFNVLTKYSDKEYTKDYLYYADPLYLFDYCKTNFSRNVALLHDYNLYEFTIVVRK